MREFVELQGASGASYRFRLWAGDNAHPPIAGNYVVARDTADGFVILDVNVSEDLSLVRKALKPSIRDQAGLLIYTRLNISRAARTAEHEDLLAAGKLRRSARARAAERPAASAIKARRG